MYWLALFYIFYFKKTWVNEKPCLFLTRFLEHVEVSPSLIIILQKAVYRIKFLNCPRISCAYLAGRLGVANYLILNLRNVG